MREPEMVGPAGGTGTSRGDRAVAPISDGACRGRLCAETGYACKVGQAGCPMVAAQLVVGGIEAYRILGLTFDRRRALLARFL